MIKTDANRKSLKAIKAKEKTEQEQMLREKCEALAIERYGEEKLVQLSNANKGLWFLTIEDDDGEIEKMGLMKPIDRNILSYASTKMTDEGISAFLEACMNECFLEGDREIIDDDEYFIPASQTFNKILEGKKATLLKR